MNRYREEEEIEDVDTYPEVDRMPTHKRIKTGMGELGANTFRGFIHPHRFTRFAIRIGVNRALELHGLSILLCSNYDAVTLEFQAEYLRLAEDFVCAPRRLRHERLLRYCENLGREIPGNGTTFELNYVKRDNYAMPLPYPIPPYLHIFINANELIQRSFAEDHQAMFDNLDVPGRAQVLDAMIRGLEEALPAPFRPFN